MVEAAIRSNQGARPLPGLDGRFAARLFRVASEVAALLDGRRQETCCKLPRETVKAGDLSGSGGSLASDS